MNNNSVLQLEPRPRIMKTNINKITRHVSKRITEIGYDVFISYSNKSQSRYLEIMVSEAHKIVIRISDHPAEKKNRWRYRFDIYTNAFRPGAINYIEFFDAIKLIIGSKRQKTAENISGEVPEKEA